MVLKTDMPAAAFPSPDVGRYIGMQRRRLSHRRLRRIPMCREG